MSKHISKVSTLLLAGFLGTAGIAHFVVPKPFNALIPDWLPGDAVFYTYIRSGRNLDCCFVTKTKRPKPRRMGRGRIVYCRVSRQFVYGI